MIRNQLIYTPRFTAKCKPSACLKTKRKPNFRLFLKRDNFKIHDRNDVMKYIELYFSRNYKRNGMKFNSEEWKFNVRI